MKTLKLAILSILLISNHSLAVDSEKLIKNYLDFQKNYLNEAINFEKSKSAPDSDEIDKLLFCQKNLPTFFSYLNDNNYEESEWEGIHSVDPSGRSKTKTISFYIDPNSIDLQCSDDEENFR